MISIAKFRWFIQSIWVRLSELIIGERIILSLFASFCLFFEFFTRPAMCFRYFSNLVETPMVFPQFARVIPYKHISHSLLFVRLLIILILSSIVWDIWFFLFTNNNECGGFYWIYLFFLLDTKYFSIIFIISNSNGCSAMNCTLLHEIFLLNSQGMNLLFCFWLYPLSSKNKIIIFFTWKFNKLII